MQEAAFVSNLVLWAGLSPTTYLAVGDDGSKAHFVYEFIQKLGILVTSHVACLDAIRYISELVFDLLHSTHEDSVSDYTKRDRHN